MTFDRPYSYMPEESFAILPNGEAVFLKDIPEEVKQRFLEDLEKERERHDRFVCDPNAFTP